MVRVSDEVRRLRRRFQERAEESQALDAVGLARDKHRPYTLDYAQRLFSDWFELRGDRAFGDDAAIVCGVARYHDRPVVFIGHQKGRDLRERTYRNFGMAKPEGYRKAIRAMQLADRLGQPLLTFIDTPGAHAGVDAAQRGQAGMIATSILQMTRLRVPIIVSVIGEGGSGGALAIAVGDRVLMQENAIYNVISPEGCAAILWKGTTPELVRKATYAFRPTARACLDLGVVDVVVPEPGGGAHRDYDKSARLLDDAILAALEEVDADPDRRASRRRKFRSMGVWGVAEPDDVASAPEALALPEPELPASSARLD
jgi:acetyl-CoA carboxylase carboxyl transferase subunit alpha